jgi:aminoglycoside phosphotransferase family enzyme/adenylate kinase family enzyme
MTDILVQAMLNPALYDHPVSGIQLVETHISWVILTGDYAYKIKKPVDLHFLDFSTLEKRRFYCHEELRLNRRLAPAIYLDVVRITGRVDQPRLDGPGEAIEYAVKMVQFPQEAQLDRMLQQGTLKKEHIDALAARAAAFHASIPGLPDDAPFGNPDQVLAPMQENFSQIRQAGCNTGAAAMLDGLSAWVDTTFENTSHILQQRKLSGYIRECHGDMHLRNVACLEDDIVMFDCIEFNENLRCIDVMSDIAFMVMDLDDRRQSGLASRFLNRYLEHSGDYAGLEALRFYLVYRALVRAKVDCIRAGQADIDAGEKAATLDEYRGYLELAERYTRPPAPILMIMCGLSGTGKTHVSDALLEIMPAVRLRSDIERKRLYGYKPQSETGSGVASGIYSESATRRTYEYLQQQARTLLENNYHAIVDAAFLKAWQRELFYDLAHATGAAVIIIECTAPEDVLRSRLRTRAKLAQDASEADLQVLEHQLQTVEPLTQAEITQRLLVDTEGSVDIDAIVKTIRARAKTA